MRNRTAILHASPVASQDDNHRQTMQAIIQRLHALTGHEMSGYKAKTFIRRLQRRMTLTQRPSLES